VLCLAPVAQASLSSAYQFNGNGNWSIDAIGSTSAAIGDLRALVPTGSTVEQAFLYQTTQSNTATLDLDFDGVTLSGADWTSLGSTTIFNLTGFRADVTAQVAAKVGAGSAAPFTFSVVESNSYLQEGASLVVVYSNPTEATRTIAILDGFTDPAGDTININLADPLTAAQLADPAFEAQMSLGIGFGIQPSLVPQVSTVDVNGQRLSSSAGGQDDGQLADGALVTVGDTFDDDFTTNPLDPFAGAPDARTDDEAYNLVSFLAAGVSSIQIDTTNPSFNDNIFFAGFNITALAGVNQPPPPPPTTSVPEPGSLALLLLGLSGIVVRRKLS